MSHSPELEQAAVILLGSFNPAIFHPSWFAAHDLIPNDEQRVPKGVKLAIAHTEVTDFSTDDFTLQVQPQRFALRALNASFYESLRDLAFSTFSILHHTPIKKMGLNRNFHFRMPSAESWHEVGDRLAPKEHWTGFLHKPGMKNLTMEGARQDDYEGFIRVLVEPSGEVRPYGIHVGVNDHYEVSDPEESQGCLELIEILKNSWTESLGKAADIAHAIVFSDEKAE